METGSWTATRKALGSSCRPWTEPRWTPMSVRGSLTTASPNLLQKTHNFSHLLSDNFYHTASCDSTLLLFWFPLFFIIKTDFTSRLKMARSFNKSISPLTSHTSHLLHFIPSWSCIQCLLCCVFWFRTERRHWRGTNPAQTEMYEYKWRVFCHGGAGGCAFSAARSPAASSASAVRV